MPHPIPKIMGVLIKAYSLLGDSELELVEKSATLLKEIKQFCNYVEGKNEELIMPIPSICIEE